MAHMAVSRKWGSISWVSLKQEPYYLGSVFRPLIFGISHIDEHAENISSVQCHVMPNQDAILL